MNNQSYIISSLGAFDVILPPYVVVRNDKPGGAKVSLSDADFFKPYTWIFHRVS